MTKEQVFELLEKAITHIDENFNGEESDIYINSQLEDNDFPLEYSVDCGISKAVILIEDTPFVIKMPFFKRYDDHCYQDAYSDWAYLRKQKLDEYAAKRALETNNPNYILTIEEIEACQDEFEEECPEPHCEDDDFFYDLDGASYINLGPGVEPAIPDWDYCRLESVIYQLAVEAGLGAYFAEEAYLGTIDETPVYYQTRCTPMSDMSIDYASQEYRDKKTVSRKFCDNHNIHCFDEVWIYDFIAMYGEDEFERLNAFLDRYEIDDLRACNIGYLDGAPILFDYSGYRGW